MSKSKTTPSFSVVHTGDFVPQDAPKVRPIANSRELFDVYSMTHDFYVNRSVLSVQTDGMWITHPEFDHAAETTILVAEVKGQIVGSLSVTRDGARGLPVPRDLFKNFTLIRVEGRQLAAFWRLVVRSEDVASAAIVDALLKAGARILTGEAHHTALLVISPEFVPASTDLLHATPVMKAWCSIGPYKMPCALLRADIENLPHSSYRAEGKAV